MQALRFLTAGSVDDGKSTLIGRLLLDSRAILADQLEALHQRAAGAAPDLSLLTDGLEAEREQGITIDVAWRYFATPRRKFIIADAPGHEQYTRNMVTAAAGSDAAVVLVDITKIDWRMALPRLLPQTRRHALLAQLLGVQSLVFAVNKLDAVDDPALAFAKTRAALLAFAAQAGMAVAGVVPVSALRGDNVATPMVNDWYGGPSLLGLLESLPNAAEAADQAFGLPVQYVAKHSDDTPSGSNPERVLWGRIASGQVAVGDTVTVHPANVSAQVRGIRHAGHAVATAHTGQSAGLLLDRQLDVSRGDWLVAPGSVHMQQQFAATLAWLDTEPAVVGRKYLLRHGNRWVNGRISAIDHRLDITTLAAQPASSLGVNDIGRVQVSLQQPLPLTPYATNRIGGALIVVDPSTHRTAGALLVAAAVVDKTSAQVSSL